MAKSLEQLQAQIAKLEAQAQAVREKEAVGVIARIKEAIKHYRLTPAQLFDDVPSTGRATPATGKAYRTRSNASAKFGDGQGRTWSGLGKRPDWFKAALAAGKTPDELLISKSSGVAVNSKPKRASVKRAAGGRKKGPGLPKYQSAEGQTWTGVGKRPGWFVAALEAGKTEDDLLIKQS
ncbi:H-NS family nucleoid-associated regulatory protein [Mitsuaria sp. 7]|uniref:H-NS family nucleoid-associated regulatory protein n=1 Tax=Mitsuaria sp. 7 TaxID=1658665 RepID=UPI0009EED962|nr:H-NS family nucleoid-associated regulatory protein [Mitsuaria sp. 7]